MQTYVISHHLDTHVSKLKFSYPEVYELSEIYCILKTIFNPQHLVFLYQIRPYELEI